MIPETAERPRVFAGLAVILSLVVTLGATRLEAATEPGPAPGLASPSQSAALCGKAEPSREQAPEAKPCRDNDGCGRDEYCKKPVGKCDEPGECAIRPEICAQIFDPVCGCDHKVYSNSCMAAAHGINVLGAESECPQE